MVAILGSATSIRHTFFYNENKVAAGVALCLMAENYPRNLEALSEHIKLDFLLKMAAQNPRSRVNCVHLSLNFDPADDLSRQQLQEIAKLFMKQTPFGNQPYLVYQHLDAGHPHLHILSTKIEVDGKIIQSPPSEIFKMGSVCRELEIQFSLTTLEELKRRRAAQVRQQPGKVIYGQRGTCLSVSDVLGHVLENYNYTSVKELNAVLGLYHVMADMGKEKSRLFQHHGLIYHVLDENNQYIGAPLKASFFDQKPTLTYLEQKFIQNKQKRITPEKHIRNTIDFYGKTSRNRTWVTFKAALNKERIHPLIYQEKQAGDPEIVYVDHKNKAVYHENALGEPYGIKGIQQRFALDLGTFGTLKKGRYQDLTKPDETMKAYEKYDMFISRTREETHRLSGTMKWKRPYGQVFSAKDRQKKKKQHSPHL